MPYKDPIIRNEKQRERYHKNKNNPDYYTNSEKRKEYNKQWRENNRDWHKGQKQRIRRKVRLLRRINKELENLTDKYEYDCSDKKKCSMRYTWCRDKDKVFKLRECQFEMVWAKYTKAENCQLCNISLKKVKKCMEHHHPSGYFRFVACHRCNGYLRYVDEDKTEVMKELLQR